MWRLMVMMVMGCAQVEQSASCNSYVACVRAQDAAKGVETDMVRFEPAGDCWGNPEGAALCDRACSNGLLWLQEQYADLPEECGA